jgi:predicted ATPase
VDGERWRRISDLFAGALERDPPAREAFLDEVPDAEIREEVESLLAAHGRSGVLDRLEGQMDDLRRRALEGATSESAVDVGPGSESPAEILEPGRRLGRYVIGERLGAGGMGEVYRARDTRLERDVAVKILGRRARGRAGALERFEREARAASALNHPNIVTVYDIAEEDSSPYIVMELVEGESLRRMLAAPWPFDMLLSIAIQISEGLAAAHARQIVHRDLKPENVLVTPSGIAKILDFGLAQFRFPSEGATPPGPTEPGRRRALHGTIGYMSPELVSGAAAADPRSDQFSLGAILFEMATGARAYPGKTTLEVLERTLRHEVRPIADLRPDVSPSFARIVSRCLKKSPDERYSSTKALLEDLRREREIQTRTVRRDATRHPALPDPLTALIGRDREVAEIARLIGAGQARLITLTGPAGTGKTRLAIQAARDFEARHPGGVFFAPLGPITEASLVGPAIAQAVGALGTASRSRSPLASAIADLRQTAGPTLLILDNFEQVLEAAPAVSEILAACPNLTVLATSREMLRLYGEHAFPVAPLALPDRSRLPSVEELSRCPAVALFVERAAAADPTFGLAEDNAAAVAELCVRLDGLPLALELAAAHARVLSPDALLTRLDHRLQLLTGGARDVPGRQQTLRRAIDWSHQLLDATEQAVFRRLSVFAGGFTLEAAQAVADPFDKLGTPAEGGLGALVHKSLLQTVAPSDGEPRFRMLETIRDYALEKLVESGEDPAVREAHAAYFLVLAEEGTAAPASSEPPPWFRRFTAEHDNFRTALEWLVRQGRAEWALRLALGLFPFWERGEHLAEGRRRLDDVLALEATKDLPVERGKAMFSAGVLASMQGEIERGIALHTECLRVSRSLGDRLGVVVTLLGLGPQYVARGDYAEARRVLEESLKIWEELGDRAGYARSLSNLAFVARSQGRFEEARALYRRAAAMFDLSGDSSSRAWAVNHEGDVARDQDDLEAAEVLYGLALETFQSLNDRWGIGSCLADRGTIARRRGDLGSAADLYRDALANFVELDHLRGVARLLEALAGLAADEGRPERGIRLAAAASVLRERLGVPAGPDLRRELDRDVAAMRQDLGESAVRRIWEEACATPLEDAVRLARA